MKEGDNMLKETHRYSAMAITAIAVNTLPVEPFLYRFTYNGGDEIGYRAYAVLFALFWGVWVGSTLPDIDQKLKLPHRTWTHTIWFVGLLALLSYMVYEWGLGTQLLTSGFRFNRLVAMMFIGITIGSAIHILMDFLSVASVDIFYPMFGYKNIRLQDGTEVQVSKGYRLPLYKVGQPFFGMTNDLWLWVMLFMLFVTLLRWEGLSVESVVRIW